MVRVDYSAAADLAVGPGNLAVYVYSSRPAGRTLVNTPCMHGTEFSCDIDPVVPLMIWDRNSRLSSPGLPTQVGG